MAITVYNIRMKTVRLCTPPPSLAPSHLSATCGFQMAQEARLRTREPWRVPEGGGEKVYWLYDSPEVTSGSETVASSVKKDV